MNEGAISDPNCPVIVGHSRRGILCFLLSSVSHQSDQHLQLYTNSVTLLELLSDDCCISSERNKPPSGCQTTVSWTEIIWVLLYFNQYYNCNQMWRNVWRRGRL